MDALTVIALIAGSLITGEAANRTRKASAKLALTLAVIGWCCALAAAFDGWVVLGLHGTAAYFFDAVVLAVVSATASRL